MLVLNFDLFCRCACFFIRMVQFLWRFGFTVPHFPLFFSTIHVNPPPPKTSLPLSLFQKELYPSSCFCSLGSLPVFLSFFRCCECFAFFFSHNMTRLHQTSSFFVYSPVSFLSYEVVFCWFFGHYNCSYPFI